MQDEGSSSEKYVSGHLLNNKLGGPGRAHNLFPITAYANQQHNRAGRQQGGDDVGQRDRQEVRGGVLAEAEHHTAGEGDEPWRLRMIRRVMASACSSEVA